MNSDDVLLWLDREDQKRTAAVRAVLIEQGREDLALDLDRRIRDINLGLDSARSAWHSISAAQRRMLELLREGKALVRAGGGYVAVGAPGGYAIKAGRLPTARALCAHELIACDGCAMDPEARFVLTERGRFVLSHGRNAAQHEPLPAPPTGDEG